MILTFVVPAVEISSSHRTTGMFPFYRTFGNYTMDVIASLGFGMDIDCQTNPENTFVKYAKELITFNFRIILIILCKTVFY